MEDEIIKELEKRVSELEKGLYMRDEFIQRLKNSNFLYSETDKFETIAGASGSAKVETLAIKRGDIGYMAWVHSVFGEIDFLPNNWLTTKGTYIPDGAGITLFTTESLPNTIIYNFYYVIDSQGDTFRISESKGGPAVTFTGRGVGLHFFAW